MRDSQLRRPLTFLRQSHSFFRESCSIFCLSPSWAGGPLSAFFAHCCNLSCKLQEAEHHEKQNSFIYSVSLTLRRETTGGVKLICYQMSVLPCLQPSPPAARAVHHPPCAAIPAVPKCSSLLVPTCAQWTAAPSPCVFGFPAAALAP